jgi:D-beta-D-heptose 7-phosphate kinase/D-beta-D-heptose 1-phosphate adenosyltransferase
MNIIVIGNVMLDINYFCEVKRNATEAKLPIYNNLYTKYNLGGAGNVAFNFKKLNCNIELISKVGNDFGGIKIKELLDSFNIKNKLFITNNSTIIKNRIIYNNNIVNRHDIEELNNNNDIGEEILEYLFSLNNIDAIVISEYKNGLINKNTAESIIQYANDRKIYTFIDSKINDVIKYKNCFLFKPNYFESKNITNRENIDEMFYIFKNNYNFKNIVITNAEKGLYINDINNHIKSNSKINVVDETGSGDLTLVVIVYIFLKENNLLRACNIANYVAGKGTMYIGNYHISINDINEYIEPIIKCNEIDKIQIIRNKSKNIVFTCGCFDLLHSAHIKLLQFCKEKGEIFVLGLNSDNSIKKLKGEMRPINNINERCELLINLNIIDYIIIFDNETPLEIIKVLKPDIIIKGGDYSESTVIGKEYCGELLFFNYIDNISSTITINKIKNSQ